MWHLCVPFRGRSSTSIFLFFSFSLFFFFSLLSFFFSFSFLSFLYSFHSSISSCYWSASHSPRLTLILQVACGWHPHSIQHRYTHGPDPRRTSACTGQSLQESSLGHCAKACMWTPERCSDILKSCELRLSETFRS